MARSRRHLLILGILGLATITTSSAFGQNKYDPGASDTEIKIGNIMPYSGPLSACNIIGITKADLDPCSRCGRPKGPQFVTHNRMRAR